MPMSIIFTVAVVVLLAGHIDTGSNASPNRWETSNAENYRKYHTVQQLSRFFR